MPEAVDRFRGPLPHRPREQGIPEGAPSRRPDGHDHPGGAGQGPRPRPERRSTTCISAAACPAARPATTWRRVVAILLGYDRSPGPRSPATARRPCRPRGWRSTRSRPARATCSSPPASRPSRASPRAPPTTCPTPTTRCSATPAARTDEQAAGWPGLARPPRGRRASRRLHRDGPDRRERRPAARPRPQGARRVRRPQPEPRREGDRRRVLGARDHAGHHARRHRGQRRRRPAGRGDLRRDLRAQAGVPARRRGHRGQLLRAERRRGRGRDHVRHQGRRARADPAGPDRLHRRHRPLPGDHGPGPGRGHRSRRSPART